MKLNTASIVSSQVIALFIIMVIGYGARLFGLIDKNTTKRLGKVLVYVTNPLVIVTAFQQKFDAAKLSVMLYIFGASLIIHLAATVIALLVFRGGKGDGVYRFCTVFSNCGYMGYPLLRAVFSGNDGLFYGACYVMVFTVYMWTMGIFMLSAGKHGGFKSLRKALINPGIIAAVVGVLLYVFRISLPSPVLTAVNMTADMTFPLSMIIIGSMLKELNLKDVFVNGRCYAVAFIKLLVLPLLTLLLCMLFSVGKGTTYLCVVMTATPVAAKAPILADIYGGDKDSALVSVELTTILSVVSIPLMMYLLELVF